MKRILKLNCYKNSCLIDIIATKLSKNYSVIPDQWQWYDLMDIACIQWRLNNKTDISLFIEKIKSEINKIIKFEKIITIPNFYFTEQKIYIYNMANVTCFLIVPTGDYQADSYTDVNGIEVPRPLELWQRADGTGEKFILNNAPVGAMWEATWYTDFQQWCGTDGKAYIVKTPAGDWHIDGRASNCTMPDDTKHKCWCRHGEAPNFTVNKDGNTCSAGGGSIQIKEYHGHLINGELTNC